MNVWKRKDLVLTWPEIQKGIATHIRKVFAQMPLKLTAPGKYVTILLYLRA